LRKKDRKSYTGLYQGPGIKLELAWEPNGDPALGSLLRMAYEYEDLILTAVPREEDVFELLEFEGQVLFARDAEGHITGFELWFGMPDWSPYRRWNFDKV
jgi:hypothetical protein